MQITKRVGIVSLLLALGACTNYCEDTLPVEDIAATTPAIPAPEEQTAQAVPVEDVQATPLDRQPAASFATAPVPAPSPAEPAIVVANSPTTLLTLEFDAAKPADFEAALKQAIDRSPKNDPKTQYDVVSYVIMGGDEAANKKQIALATQSQNQVAKALMGMGISADRIMLRSQYGNGKAAATQKMQISVE